MYTQTRRYFSTGVVVAATIVASLATTKAVCDQVKSNFLTSHASQEMHKLLIVAHNFMSLKREAIANGDSKGAEHLDKIIESIGQEIYRKKCSTNNPDLQNSGLVVTIEVSSPTTTIILPMLIDEGSLFDVVVETEDAAALGLSKVGVSSDVHADGSRYHMTEYETANVSIEFCDGSKVTRPVRPVSFARPAAEGPELGFVVAPQRLLGLHVLFSMGVEPDYRQRRLVRFVRRV